MDVEDEERIFGTVAWVAERWIAAGHPAAAAYLDRLGVDLHLDTARIEALRAAARATNDALHFAANLEPWARLLALHATLLVGIADGRLDANERLWIHRLAQALGLGVETAEQLERSVWADLAGQKQGVGREPLDTSATIPDEWRAVKIGAGVLGGAVLLALGGLAAAPLIGGALGTLMGLSGAAATSAGLASVGGGAIATGGFGMLGGQIVIAGVAGVAGGAEGGRRMARRTQRVSELSIERIGSSASAHAVVGVPGFLNQSEAAGQQWSALSAAWPHADTAGLNWESQALRDLGMSLATLAGQAGAAGTLAQAAMSATRHAWGAIALPALALQGLSLIDNPWDVAQNRAIETGHHLATAIANGDLGRRPVTLVGFSLGTRVILETVAELARAGERGWLSGVILLGGATPRDHGGLDACAQVVRGPVVNAYAENDWVLWGLFRAREWSQPIGLAPLHRAGVVDLDLTAHVGGHLDYVPRLHEVLRLVRAACAAPSASTS